MDSYENYGGGDQELTPPKRSASVPKPPGAPPSKPPGPPPSRPSAPPGKIPPGPPTSPVKPASNPYDEEDDSPPIVGTLKDDNYDESDEQSSPKTAPPAVPARAPPGPPGKTPPGPPTLPSKDSKPPTTPKKASSATQNDSDGEEGGEASFVSVAIPTDSTTTINKKHTSTSPIHDNTSTVSPTRPNKSSAFANNEAAPQASTEEEEDEEPTGPEVRVKENMPTSRGLVPVTRSHTEIPSDMLKRHLLKHEVVTGQFDFYYPQKGFSKRFTFLLIFLTMGMYLVVIGVRNLLNYLRRLLFPCQACADSVYFRRGKLVVTNKGRVICWNMELQQHNRITNQTVYRVGQSTHILNVEDIAQISLYYSDKLLCMNCCCGDFTTGIDVSFNAYNHLALPWSRYLYTNHPSNFLLNLGSYIKNSVAYSVYNSIVYGNKEALVLRLISNPDDKIYDGEYGLEPLEDLCRLNEAVCKAMCNRSPSYPQKPSAPTTDPVKRNTHTFLSAKAAVDLEVQKQYGVEHVHIAGVKEIFQDLTNFTLVDDDGNVTVPIKWIPLSLGEEIVSAVGQFYKPTCAEIILSVFTLGWYYVRFIRSKLFERSAIILTTHRVVEVLLFQQRGKVPAELGSVDVIIRSYFPKQVHSGYIRSGDGHSIESAIYSSHGQLVVSLPSTQLLFAQKMQLVSTRETALDLREVEGMLPDISHLQSATTTGNNVMNRDEESEKSTRSNFAKIKYDDAKLSPIDQILLPLMPNEQLLHRFQGGSGYKPCCLLNFGCFKSYLCNFANYSPNVVYRCGLVSFIQLLTCSKRPLLTTPSCLVTNHTLYYIACTTTMSGANDAQTIGMNYAGCCGSGYRLEPFILTWLPIRKLKDHDVQIDIHGLKPFGPLLCCAQSARSVEHRYSISVNSTEGISYPLTEDVPFKAWIKDARLTKVQNTLSAVQVIIAKE
eukprot:gene26386-32960_t